jgi:uncharacterized protein YjlB
MPEHAVRAADLIKPLTFCFTDDGLVPNNEKLPFAVYRRAVEVADSADPAALFEEAFARNGWGNPWRNGIYPFVHYHSKIHEVLGIARGSALVRFGGRTGRELEIAAGDVAVLPAGTGHQRLSASADLLVVGAYPPNGTYDLCRPTADAYARARTTTSHVPLPPSDPLYGRDGPLMRLWLS